MHPVEGISRGFAYHAFMENAEDYRALHGFFAATLEKIHIFSHIGRARSKDPQ
jgi:hypothetical protein